MPDGGWDFQVERVHLNGLTIDAGQRLGMVIVQPEYELAADAVTPFRISEVYREAQKAVIEKAFQIRAGENQGRNVPVPFILFPEGAIPVSEPDGLDCLKQQMEQARGDIIFIGGLEGLSPQQAREVANRFAPGVNSAKPAFTDGTFVNLCVIAIKSADGPLSWYFQAKLRPSRWEQPRNMAHGQRVLHFTASRIAFLCQICFDHIATEGQEALNTALCRKLIANTQPGDAAALDFVFVPQYNQQPDHLSARQNARRLINYQDRALKNDMLAIVVINKAASVQEPSEYGRSGFHYRVGRWQIPVADIGPKGYELYDSDDIASAVFRKRTQAIHVATLVPPAHNIGDSGNPRQPLENPRSYLIKGSCDVAACPCLPGTLCEVGTYVECDCLPCRLRDPLLSAFPARDDKKRWQGFDVSQSKLLERHYGEIRKDLLMIGCGRARELVSLLLHMHKDGSINPDLWSSLQFEAVVELVSALSVLAELQPVSFETSPQWTALVGEFLALAVLDGADRKYSWDEMEFEYRKTFEGQYFRPDTRRKPVLLAMLRSRGLVQPLVKPSSLEFTKPADPNRLGDENSFTKPSPLQIYVCQDNLFEGARQAPKIEEFLKTEMRCFLG
ncbi:MAG: hypothetical protein V2A69_09285 [Pseudomonadota bacterium]